MGLHWSIERCAEPEKLDRTVLEGLIWTTIRVDMGQITEKNVDTFIARTLFIEKVNGSILLQTDDQGVTTPRYLTAADIRPFIGFKANVSDLTDAQWLKKVWKIFREDIAREQNKETS